MVEWEQTFAVFGLKFGHGAYDGLVAGGVHVEGLEHGDQGRVADFGVGAELVDERGGKPAGFGQLDQRAGESFRAFRALRGTGSGVVGGVCDGAGAGRCVVAVRVGHDDSLLANRVLLVVCIAVRGPLCVEVPAT
jgi:hypothetical protein